MHGSNKQHNNKKKLNKREREEKYKRKLVKNARLYHGVYYFDEKLVKGKGFIPVDKPYYKRFYRGNHPSNRYRFFKKHANSVVRNFGGEIPGRSGYKKVFDYWWTVD